MEGEKRRFHVLLLLWLFASQGSTKSPGDLEAIQGMRRILHGKQTMPKSEQSTSRRMGFLTLDNP